MTARRPLLYGVGSTCLYLVVGSCRYLNTGTYREPHVVEVLNLFLEDWLLALEYQVKTPAMVT